MITSQNFKIHPKLVKFGDSDRKIRTGFAKREVFADNAMNDRGDGGG